MLLADPYLISKIDKYSSESLGIPMRELMLRAGKAVAEATRSLVPMGSRVDIFAGKGNNGGDGYAAALLLMHDYSVRVYDVFSSGQRTDEGKYFLNAFLSEGGNVSPLAFTDEQLSDISDSDCLIDAVFGTGFFGNLPEEAIRLAQIFRRSYDKKRLAIDVPLGVNASDGSVDDSSVYAADVTVSLGYAKTGLVSYPAKEYIGRLIIDNIGLQNDAILHEFEFTNYLIDYELAASFIPKREKNSNKGSFGKLLAIVGSDGLAGAAHLSLEAALRSGVGLVSYLGEKQVCDQLLLRFPEIIYKPCSIREMTDKNLELAYTESKKHSAVLIGSGSSVSDGLLSLVSKLLSTEGPPLILDADALNVLSQNLEQGKELLKASRRSLILTPHPLELSRLTGIPTDRIQAHRLSLAKQCAREIGCVLVLKGAATIVTDGHTTYINSSGSSALAKAGSGDVLAGAIASYVASGENPLSASALGVYIHGLAADVLAERLSEFGVTPSDLPVEIAAQMSKMIKSK